MVRLFYKLGMSYILKSYYTHENDTVQYYGCENISGRFTAQRSQAAVMRNLCTVG